MYVCIYIYTHIHICNMYTYIYIYIHVRVCDFTHASLTCLLYPRLTSQVVEKALQTQRAEQKQIVVRHCVIEE